jgi:hypothetical protein
MLSLTRDAQKEGTGSYRTHVWGIPSPLNVEFAIEQTTFGIELSYRRSSTDKLHKRFVVFGKDRRRRMELRLGSSGGPAELAEWRKFHIEPQRDGSKRIQIMYRTRNVGGILAITRFPDGGFDISHEVTGDGAVNLHFPAASPVVPAGPQPAGA